LIALVDLAAGVVAISYPNITAVVLVVIVAIWAIAFGVLELFAAFGAGETVGTRAWFVVAGLVSLAFGFVLVGRPDVGAVSLAVIYGIFSLAFGITEIVLGVQARRAMVAARAVSRPLDRCRARAGCRRVVIGTDARSWCTNGRKEGSDMAMTSEGGGSREPATAGGGGRGSQRSPIVWQGLSALLLLAMGGIHLYLALNGVGGVLGLLFVLNAVGALVLAVAIVALRRWPLLVASLLSLLFMMGTLLALVLALTIGLFGIRETLDFQLVPTTLVVESVGTVVLAVTTAMVFRQRRGV